MSQGSHLLTVFTILSFAFGVGGNFKSNCKANRCALALIREDGYFANQTELKSCFDSKASYKLYKHKGAVAVRKLVFQKHAPMPLLEALLLRDAAVNCDRDCSLGNFGSYYVDFIAEKHRKYPYEHLICSKDDVAKCLWQAKVKQFLLYFAIFMPTAIVANGFNISILRAMLTGKSGAALFFHIAEIVTDLLLCLVMSFNSVRVPRALLIWFKPCPLGKTMDVEKLFESFEQYFQLLNQFFVCAIIWDRVTGVKDPLTYRAMHHKKRAMHGTAVIVAIVTTAFMPHLILSIFASKGHLATFVRFALQTTTWLIVVPQIILSAQLIRAVKDLNSEEYGDEEKEEKEKRRKMEKDKTHLLYGTVGLNWAVTTVMLINQFFVFRAGKGYGIELKTSDFVGTVNRNGEARALMLIAVYLNGTMSMLFHVIFTKAYRDAFFDTGLGKVLGKVCGLDKKRVHSETAAKAKSITVKPACAKDN